MIFGAIIFAVIWSLLAVAVYVNVCHKKFEK